MQVHKFGGGVLATREQYRNAAKIIMQSRADVAVVSAAQGVTDTLISILNKARAGKTVAEELIALKELHSQLSVRPTGFSQVFNEIERILEDVRRKRKYNDKTYAFVLSRGEYLSALVMNTHLPDYSFWPAEKGIRAKGTYRDAQFDFAHSQRPPAKSIVTGFYGIDKNRNIRLFGRGGTDYTASSLAKILHANKLVFWKDVHGLLTADPKHVKGARFIKEAHHEEVRELVWLGAKVLHHAALEPVMKTRTQVELKSVFKPREKGTTISPMVRTSNVAGIAGKTKQAVVSVSGQGLVGVSGVAARILGRVAKLGVPIDVIATSQGNLSFTINSDKLAAVLKALRHYRRRGFEITGRKGLALVGLVGRGVKENPQISGRALIALARKGIPTEMHSQGASGIGFSVITPEKRYKQALRTIHKEFFGRQRRKK